MECIWCGSDRILEVSAKCSDTCTLTFKGVEHQGYVPIDSAVGGGDYIELDICLSCGVAQGLVDDQAYMESLKGTAFYKDQT
jgi:hypothetical protein